jgi:lipopolysaccharide/colanic/teichoic acid biosynthesis glycosyltransferase
MTLDSGSFGEALNQVFAGSAVLEERPRVIQRAIIRPVPCVFPLETLLISDLPRYRRLLDIIGATAGLLLLAPILGLVMLAIWITAGRPIFFVQERTGLGQRRFRMYKFRTMVRDAHAQFPKIRHLNEMTGPLIKIKNDPRLIRIGNFLRRSSLDELPQLVNVIKGDMTLIGPRALSPLPSQYEPWQRRRFAVQPGLACAWQAGHRAERDFLQWMRSDLRYIDKGGAWTDFSLFLRIAIRIVCCKGAS